MSKLKASAPVPVASQAPVPQFKVGKLPRITGHKATKNGKAGTEGTWAAIAAHMESNGGTISQTELDRICTEQGDSGFGGYAKGKQRRWLVPVA